jgi:uncharacterized phage protein (TIGR02218 family)
MRDAPASIATMLGTTELTLARCFKIVLRDGTELGLTDHDESLVVPLDNDFYGPITYSAGHGVIVGDIEITVGLESDNTETSIPFGEMVRREAVLARRFHMADVYIFDVDWTQDSPEPLEIIAGYIAEARTERNMAVFEIRSQADRWNTVIGSLAAPRCKATFGDRLCGATPTNYATSVIDALSNMRFLVDVASMNLIDDFFRFGEVEFLTGDLAGTWPFEVIAYDGYTGEVEVLSPMPGLPAFGDQLLLKTGCSRIKESDDPTVPTCFTNNNVTRFRGLDQLPGTDRYLRWPIPGEGGTA